MADLKLTADFTDLQTLKRELLDIPKKARDSARTFEAEYARVERALVRQAKQFQNNATESQKYYSQLLKLGGEAKSAERSAEVFTRALEKQEQVAQRVGKVFRDQTSQAVRSLAQEFARSGDQSAYLSGVNKIVNAQNMLQAGSRTSRSEIMRLGNEFRQQAKFANELAVAQVRAGVEVQRSARHMNRMGVVTQQAGYQIGDFLVQVQSGTNPMVAFGQQATQLAGVMTLFGGKFILLGSILGITIPLVTAIGAAIMRTRGAAEDSAQGLETLEDRLRSARVEMQGFTRDIEMYRRGIEDVGEFALLEGVEEARKTVQQIGAEIQQLQEIGAITAPNERDLAAARELLASREAELEAYKNSRREAQLLGAAEERRVEAIRLYFEYAQRDAELIQQRNQGVRAILAAVEEERQILLERTRLSEIEAQQGKESSEYRNTQAEIEERIYRAQLSQNNILGNNQEAMVRLWKEAQTAAEEAEKVNSALSLVSQLDLPITARVSALASMLGIAADEALRLMNNLPVGTTFGDQNALSGLTGGQLVFGGMEGDIPAARGRSGAGGAAPGIGGFAQSLLTQMEQLELFRENALEQLENFNSLELELLGGHAEAKFRIEQEYQGRLDALRRESRQQTLSETSSLFGALANIASVGGQKTVKAVATFQAIEGTINAYGAAIKALNTPGISLAGRFAAYASVLGAGLKGVAAIRSAGGVGGGGGGAASVEPIPATASAAPQRVIIEGIDRDSLISGEQLSRLFDRLYEENNERGVVFSVAR